MTLHDLFVHMSTVERLSLAAIGTSAVLFALLERIIPYSKGQALFREGFFDDFALYTIAQSYVLGIVIFSIIIATFSLRVLSGLLKDEERA